MPATGTDDFQLTMDELRAVTRFVLRSAEMVHPRFTEVHPDDPRPLAAIEAARAFARGDRRSMRQRITSLDAHRAAAAASLEIPKLAARAAGDAASAAYLHPIAKAHQVGHILRAAACAARIAEIDHADNPEAGLEFLADVRRHIDPVVIDVLCRYPQPPPGRNRVDQLVATLDATLRSG